MKKQLNRKKSKRQSARHRYKVLKKISQHHKKQKKEARKNPNKKKKKDPGIPNSLPFKEEILHEAEARKQRAEEERERQKERRKKDREKLLAKKRNLDGMVKDAQKKAAEYERKQLKKSSNDGSQAKGSGAVENSLKTFYKEFKKVVDAADVILEVLDARDPLGSRCTQMEEAILESGTNKRLVLILNKIDLVPRENVELWLKHLRNEFPAVAFKASTQTQQTNLSRTKVPLQLASDDLLKSSHCLGADMLMKLLGNYCRNKDIKTAIRVGVVGFPNTGKSSIINSLKRAKACNVGSMPGMTRTMQEVHLDKHIKLLDSPGIVMATGSSDTSVILRNCVKLENLDDPITPAEAILKRCSKQQMILHYNIPDYKDTSEFLSLLARKMGRLKKGGVPDVNKAAVAVVQDWTSGKINYFTHPPEQHTLPTHISAMLVTEMGREFSLDDIMEVEENTLKGLETKSSKHMLVESLGPVMAVMDESELDDKDDMVEDDDKENSEESMDEEEESEELKGVEVAVSRSRKSSVASTESKQSKKLSKKSEDVKFDIFHQNQKRKEEFKKMKKKRKKADKLATNLSDTLIGSLTMGSGEDKDGDYDFSVLG